MKITLRKTATSSLVALFSSGLVNAGPPGQGCTGFSSSPGISSLQSIQTFQNPLYSSGIYSSSIRGGGFVPDYKNTELCRMDPRNPLCREDPILNAAKIFGQESKSVVISGSDSDKIIFDDTETGNPFDYISSLYNKVLWNNGADEGFVVLKEKDNKFEYAGGTLMPISSENNIDNTELAGNYVQFVHDAINIDKLIWYENGEFTSKGRLVKILKEKSNSNIERLRYNDTNFYIERISKSASSYTPTKDFLYVNYDHGNATIRDTKNTLEDKLPITNEQSTHGNERNKK